MERVGYHADSNPILTITFQGHPRSKVMMLIDSPGAVSYSTFVDPIVVSVAVFHIFEIKAIFRRSNGEN